MKRHSATLLIIVILASFSAYGAMKDGIQVLPGETIQPAVKNSGIDYNINLANERFDVHIPFGHNATSPFGLLVFIAPSDEIVVPPQWKSALKEQRLAWIAPQKAGNKQFVSRRAGLAVAAALKMIDELKLNSNRVYISGFSGGARCACSTAFRHPEIFSGCIAICGAEFYKPVPKKEATRNDEYGVFKLPGELAERDKHNLYFALITGKTDFRYGNMMDIYKGGFEPNGIKSKLMDINGMGHQLCTGQTLSEAIKFVDQKRPPIPLSAGSKEPRIWTDSKGETLTASLTKIEPGLVHVQLESGAILKVPISNLSETDQDFIKNAR